MKKFILSLSLLIAFVFTSQAKETISRDVNTLPYAAQTTLSQNFKGKLSFIKIDKTLGHINEYEVVLTDGTEVTFDSKGNWKSIETRPGASVPKAFVPAEIEKYAKKMHSKAKIVGIERSGNKYEVELSNGVEMIFNADGTFLRYD